MKKIIITLLFFYSFSLTAQYTNIINSKRPGFSESPYGVGTKVFQMEAGGFYQNNTLADRVFATNSNYGANLFLRYSAFLEKLEINLDTRYQKDNLSISPYSISGFSRLTLGAKYLIYNATYKDKSKEIRSWKKRHAFDWSRLVPSVGAYIGWNSNFLTTTYKQENSSIKAAVLLQNDINERFVILTNLMVDNILLDQLSYSYILTSTLAINDKLSVFFEHQGIFNKLRDNEYQFGGGFAYLASKDIQLDISARTSMIDQEFPTYYLSLGGSWRLDKHQKKLKETTLEGTKEPFLKRIFKKKKHKKKKLHNIKAKKRKKPKAKKSRKSKKGTPTFFDKKKKKKKKRKRRKKQDKDN